MHSYVQSYMNSIFKIVLEEQGYEVDDKERYLVAQKDEKKYLIQKISRLLSCKGGIEESTVICCKREVAEKLIKEAQQGKYIPAVAFGVCKYEYRDSEIVIVPLKAWNSPERPLWLSETFRGYFFNYAHINEGGIEQAIIHATVTIQYDNRI